MRKAANWASIFFLLASSCTTANQSRPSLVSGADAEFTANDNHQTVSLSSVGGWPSAFYDTNQIPVGVGLKRMITECTQKLQHLGNGGIYFFGGFSSDSQSQVRAASLGDLGANNGQRFFCTYNRQFNQISVSLADVSDVGYTSPPYLATNPNSLPSKDNHLPFDEAYRILKTELGILDDGETLFVATVLPTE